VSEASKTKTHGLTVAWLASATLHAVAIGSFFWLALWRLAPEAPSTTAGPGGGESDPGTGSTIAVDLPVVGDGVQLDDRPPDPTGDPPRVSGGDTVAHLDVGAGGHGGDSTAQSPALNLADKNERMRLSPDLVSRIDRDQLQRLRVARVRQSWEDRRSTTHPTELTLIVTGPGSVMERRPSARTMPDRGALASPAPEVRGGTVGSPGTEPDGDRPLGGAQAGSMESAPGVGVVSGRTGIDHRTSAPIASARPDVTQGPVAVPAPEPARPRDDVDSDQEVATMVRSLVHASTAGGAAGEGQGGTSGGGDPGAGAARGASSHAHPLGVGDGDILDYWTSDPRLLPYFRLLHAKIDPLWAHAFPKSAIAELKQGMVILKFTVYADGHATVQWPPVRPSGIDEFDRNCADAIRRAAPFPPIPRELGVSSLTISAPFVASNPVVR
jgi:TonB family protein